MTGGKLLTILTALRRLDDERLALALAGRPWLPLLLRRLALLSGQYKGGVAHPARTLRQARIAHLDELLRLDRLTRLPPAVVLGLARTSTTFELPSYHPSTTAN